MLSDTDSDDDPRDQLGFFDHHDEKCLPNHIPEWLKIVTQSLALKPAHEMSKHALDSDNSDDDTAQSRSQSSTTTRPAKKKTKSETAAEKEATSIKVFARQYKVDSQSNEEVLRE